MILSESAAQLSTVKGMSLRLLCCHTVFAISSFPVPDSPIISAVESVGATFITSDMRSLKRFELPTILEGDSFLMSSCRNMLL